MKKGFSVISLAFTIFVISPLFLINTKAAEIRTNEPTVSIDEYIDDDLYVSGSTIDINEDINGDLIAFGGQITINDDIYGNALIFGGIVNIKGDIRGNIICGSGQITIDGNVSEDVNVASGYIIINGNVDDNIRVGAGTVNINSKKVGGDLLISASTVKISDDTVVSGEQKINTTTEDSSILQFSAYNKLRQKGAIGILLDLLRKIGLLIGWLIVGVLLFKFTPVKSRQITDVLTDKKSSSKSFLIGCGAELLLIILTPLIIISIIIGIGQPIFQLVIALLSIAITIGGIYSATAITKMFIRSTKNKNYNKYIFPMLIGVSIYQILGWIPCCIGLTAKLIITTWGVGGVLLSKWISINKIRKESK